MMQPAETHTQAHELEKNVFQLFFFFESRDNYCSRCELPLTLLLLNDDDHAVVNKTYQEELRYKDDFDTYTVVIINKHKYRQSKR